MKLKTVRLFLAVLFQLLMLATVQAQKSKAVIAYYSGSAQALDSFDARNMTHLIYCFGHLQENRLHISREKDTALIQKMVGLKKQNPNLKVLLSLGGWGGCAPCSEVFAQAEGRAEFAHSANELLRFFKADGIDLDWEYPSIEGYPGHRFAPEDKAAFTALVTTLRDTLGPKKVITFAAGGFQKYLDDAIDWNAVMPKVDYVNLMTYDLVSGFSTTTGHHTALYSNPSQRESTDNCVQYLIKQGVDPGKLILGAAFYARTWEGVANVNNGLYQTGTFQHFIGYKEFASRLSADKGFAFYWDSTSQAPYAYNQKEKIFATFDDTRSMALKATYVLQHRLGGIMFWQLGDDRATNGLLHAINQTLRKQK